MEFCPNCGSMMKPDDGVFRCDNCGEEIEEESGIVMKEEAKGSNVELVEDINQGKDIVEKTCPKCGNQEAERKEKTAGIAGDAEQVQYYICTECGNTWE